jgi:hypothetical protein|tara:strand:+ start:35 stop:367 length:333 start_codon:yes stop_codon:yes gene_type:complete
MPVGHLWEGIALSLIGKFARGEMSLAKTFWGGYVGVSLMIAVVGGTIGTFFDLAGLPVMIVALAWALFASWAVVVAAGKNGRGAWGWIASIYVVLSSGWAVLAIGSMLLS